MDRKKAGPISFEAEEDEAPMSLKSSGLPMSFGRQKPRTKRGVVQQAVASVAEAEAEKARLSALSAQFTPFQPKAMQLTAALGSKAESDRAAEPEPEPERPLSAMELRLKAVRDRIQKASVSNQRAVLYEQRKGGSSEPSSKAETAATRKPVEEELPAEFAHLAEPAAEAEAKADKARKKRKNASNSFGWEVFNQDSRYRSYKKQLGGLPGKEDEVEAVAGDASALEARAPPPFEDFELLYGQNDHVDAGGAERLVKELNAQQSRRNNWSRRRPVNPDATVDFINERNRVFNKKLARSFDKYTVEIRQNLERGTAL